MSKRGYFTLIAALAFITYANTAFGGDKNLISGDVSFETGYGPFERKGSIDASTAFDGTRSLSLKADQSIRIPPTFKLQPGKPYTFSAYMKSDSPEATATLLIYRSNWCGRNARKEFHLTKEWKRYSVELPPQKAGDHNTFWLYVSPGKAPINIDACQFEEGKLSDYQAQEKISADLSVICPIEGNVFMPDEDVKLSLGLFNNSASAETAKMHIKIEDYYGKTVKEDFLKTDLKGKEKFSKEYQITPEKKGFYFVELKYSYGDKEICKTASFCIVNKPFDKKSGRAEIFGASGPGGERLDACKRIGVNWINVDIRWSNEIKKGVYNEKNLEGCSRFMDAIRAKGMNVAVYLRRTPAWASEMPDPLDIFPAKEEHVEEYGQFTYDMVSRFKDKAKVWQCWGGEIDGLRNHVSEVLKKDEDWFVDRYAKILEAGYKGAKKADPTCIWAGCSVSGVDCDPSTNFQLSRKIFKKAGQYMDEFVVHPYCWPRDFRKDKKVQSPEEHKLLDVYKTAAEFSGKPLWNGEYGFAIYVDEQLNSKSTKMMTDYTVRSLIITAAAPSVRRIQYFSFWHCDEGGATYDQWSWPNPRPLVPAYATAAFMLNETENPEEMQLNSKVKAFLFKKGKGSLLTLWIPGNNDIKMNFAENTALRFFDIMGNPVSVGNEIVLNGSPIYIESELTCEEISGIFKKAQFNIDPVEVALKLKTDKDISVYIRNILPQKLDGTLEIKIPATANGITAIHKELKGLRPDIPEEIKIEIPGKIDLEKLKDSPIEYEVTTTAGKKSGTWKTAAEECLYLSSEPSIDGNLKEWQNNPCIMMKDTSFLYPPDAISHKTWLDMNDLSAKVWTGWNEKNFYFAAEVSDDIHRNDSKAENIWSGDSIQMAFDALNNAINEEENGYDQDEKDFAFGLSEKDNKAYYYQYWPMPPQLPQGVECAIKRENGTTFYEIKIPFEKLSPLQPLEGKAFGYSFIIFDSDNAGRSHAEYWMNLTPGIANGKKPAWFKTFILKK